MKEIDGGLLRVQTPDTIVLGIDQSYTGFAITAMSTDLRCEDYHSWLFASQGVGVARLADISFKLRNIFLELENYYPLDAALEGYAPGAKYGREMAGELGGLVKLRLYEWWGIDTYVVAPTSLKKYVTGKGTGVPKNVMLLKTFQKWGVEFHDDNLCDSYGLARIASGRSTLEYEREIIAKLKRS